MFYKTLFVSCLFISLQIASSQSDVELFFEFFFKVYKNGTIEKLDKADIRVPASIDPETGVQSRDVIISQATGVSARIYAQKDLPAAAGQPLLVYFHGGGFSTGSAASKGVHKYVNALVAWAKIIAVSVNYRLAPENLLPIGFEDSWAAIKWAVSHKSRNGPDPWLNRVDFNRVFFTGDSSGATIAHNMAMRVGSDNLGQGVNLNGIILTHPYFLLENPTASFLSVPHDMRNNITKLWSYVCPKGYGSSDPQVNPVKDPNLAKLGSQRVLVFVAEKDPLMDAGKIYVEALGRAGKPSEVFVNKGKDHVFHLREPKSKQTTDMLDQVVSFINGKKLASLKLTLKLV